MHEDILKTYVTKRNCIWRVVSKVLSEWMVSEDVPDVVDPIESSDDWLETISAAFHWHR